MAFNSIEEEADTYLRKHRILELFEDLCTSICYDQPQEIQRYLIEQLQIKQTQGFKTGLYSPEEVENIFILFDLKREGFIMKEQAKQALKTMAASQYQLQESDEAALPEKVSKQEFLEVVEKLLGVKTKK